MFNKMKQYLLPVLVGAGGAIVVLPILTIKGSGITLIILAAVAFFSAGIWVGKMQPQSLWYAPLLMNVPLWLLFLFVHGYRPHVLHSVNLLTTFFGMFIGSRFPYTKAVPDKSTLFSVVKVYIIAIMVGIFGMPLTYFFALVLFGVVGLTPNLALLTVYPMLAVILGLKYHKWLTTGVIVCIPPILYISYATINWSNSNENVTSTLIYLPIMLMFSCLAAFIAEKLKRGRSFRHIDTMKTIKNHSISCIGSEKNILSEEDTMFRRFAGVGLVVIVCLVVIIGMRLSSNTAISGPPPGTPVIENLMGGAGIDWSPDGQWIVYAGRMDIYLIPVAGNETPVNLTSKLGYRCAFPKFTPDSRRVMFTAYETPKRIESVDLTGDNCEVVIAEGLNGNWNRDGTLLAYYTFVRNNVMIYEPATGEHRIIYDGQIVHNNPATFTKDGSSVITTIMDDDGNHNLFEVPLDGSQNIEQLNSGLFESASPQVSPDGRWILYYAKLVDEPYPVRCLRVLDMTTGLDVQLYRTPYNLSRPVWSPDGTQILYAVSHAATPKFSINVDTFTGGVPNPSAL
jgi:hypothetical protein